MNDAYKFINKFLLAVYTSISKFIRKYATEQKYK